jgi:hypothetical protein
MLSLLICLRKPLRRHVAARCRRRAVPTSGGCIRAVVVEKNEILLHARRYLACCIWLNGHDVLMMIGIDCCYRFGDTEASHRLLSIVHQTIMVCCFLRVSQPSGQAVPCGLQAQASAIVREQELHSGCRGPSSLRLGVTVRAGSARVHTSCGPPPSANHQRSHSSHHTQAKQIYGRLGKQEAHGRQRFRCI